MIHFFILISILTFGYNLSNFCNSYLAISNKAKRYRQILAAENELLENLRRTNCLLTLGAAAIYIVLLIFCDFTYYVLAAVVLKACLSLYVSDQFQTCVVKGTDVNKSLYYKIKADAFANLVGALLIAVALVV